MRESTWNNLKSVAAHARSIICQQCQYWRSLIAAVTYIHPFPRPSFPFFPRFLPCLHVSPETEHIPNSGLIFFCHETLCVHEGVKSSKSSGKQPPKPTKWRSFKNVINAFVRALDKRGRVGRCRPPAVECRLNKRACLGHEHEGVLQGQVLSSSPAK